MNLLSLSSGGLFLLGLPAIVWLVWLIRNDKQKCSELTSDDTSVAETELFVSGFYLLYGMLLLTSSVSASGVALVMSGIVLGFGLRKVDLAETLFVFMSLMIIGIVLGIATVVMFTSPVTFFTFLPGLAIAFAFGQIVGMFARTFFQKPRMK